MSEKNINENEILENTECCGSDCCETTTTSNPSITTQPKFYVSETDSGITVEIDLPDVAKQNTKITSEENQLTISATRETYLRENWNQLNHSEQPTDYKLKLNLHPKLNLTETKATFKNGTLILEVPKKEEALPKQINILN